MTQVYTMKEQMPRKFYVCQFPIDEQGSYDPDNGRPRYVVAYKHKGAYRWEWVNVFDDLETAKRVMYEQQMREFYYSMEDAFDEGRDKGAIAENQNRDDILC